MRWVKVLLCAVLTLCAGCGKKETSEVSVETSKPTASPAETTASAELSEDEKKLEAVGDVEVEENLFSVEITIPADLAEDVTDEELAETAREDGIKSAVRNEDGSVTYVMTKKKHQEIMESIDESFDASLEELVSSEEYPSFVKVEHSDDYAKWTVTTTASSSDDLTLNETISVMIFYMYAGIYHAYNGTTIDDVVIDFVNADTGEVIYTYNP